MATTPEFQSHVINSGSWGAFIFNWMYFLVMRAWQPAIIVFILAAIPVVNLGAFIYAARAGKRIAWQTRQWRDFDDFLACQRTWDLWAKIILGIEVVLLTLAVMVPTLLRGG